MSARKVFFAALLGMCWYCSTVQAQNPYSPANMPAPLPKGSAPAAPGAESADAPGTGLSSWITYNRDNCCTGSGGGAPIQTEVIFRIGPSIPVGGEFLGRNLDTGWMIEGGARALFFNHASSAAWAVEFGISNTYNSSHSTDTTILRHDVPSFPNTVAGLPPLIPANTPIPVSVNSLNRTFANLGLGREWFVGAPGNSDEWHLRFGTDFGGRYGSATVRFLGTALTTPGHHTQPVEGIFAAIHADLEIPYGRCTYLAGVRGEYGFTWSNVFDQGQGDMQDLTVLFNLGVRF